jgi:tetratricopeptide (TPR) repeat protein
MTVNPMFGTPPSQMQIDLLVTAFRTKPRGMFDADAAAFDATFPLDYTAQNLLGALYANLKDFERAEAAFRKALAARPDDVGTLFVSGVTLYELRR